jgi:ubiquinone/menaquinone biosynthesis C-methylase UbiE
MSTENERVHLSPARIQRLYNFLTPVYDLLTRYEMEPQKKALEIADVKEGFRVLEVGFGTGKILIELSKKVGSTGIILGLDVSLGMVKKASMRTKAYDPYKRAELVLGDGRDVPLIDSVFDLVFSSYVFDLIDTPSIPKVLSELKRLLRSGGRLVLVSLSKGSKWYDNMRLYEWVYRRWPMLLGGCRPVTLKPYLQGLGFKKITSEFVHAGHLMPTEIVLAEKS